MSVSITKSGPYLAAEYPAVEHSGLNPQQATNVLVSMLEDDRRVIQELIKGHNDLARRVVRLEKMAHTP
jgi:hypothetical protein